jgi:hypothetical protein
MPSNIFIGQLRNRAENDPAPWLRKRAKELIAELDDEE